MLLELSITDFAIIESSTIQFSEGLNAITGETGAGKSIVLEALGAVLGSRVSADLVRNGAKVARVEAAFAIQVNSESIGPMLDDLGINRDEAELVFTREIQASGRSTARINGRLTTASELSRIGSLLVDIHGQSDHLAILKPAEQRDLLDRFGLLVGRRQQVSEQFHAWNAVRRRIQELSTDARTRAQLVDLLRFQIDEIRSAELSVAEESALTGERDVLRNADRLRSDALIATGILTSEDPNADGDILSSLRKMATLVADIALLDTSSTVLGERANELSVLADELARDLRDYAETVESDDARLAEVEDRLALFQTLRRKYGATIEDVIAFEVEASQQLASLTSSDFDLGELEEREQALAKSLAASAKDLSRFRSLNAKELAQRIAESVQELNLGSAQVSIEVAQRVQHDGIEFGEAGRVHIDETGADTVQFMIAANAGETLKPLARVASGGETARLMLATKAILSDVDQTPTLVFDEIDVGIGGRSGQVVGEKLWHISRQHQVIVISHLAQVPAFADSHFKIEKSLSGARTVSSVRALEDDARIEELATMIDGKPPSATSRANAREMRQRSEVWSAQQH